MANARVSSFSNLAPFFSFFFRVPTGARARVHNYTHTSRPPTHPHITPAHPPTHTGSSSSSIAHRAT